MQVTDYARVLLKIDVWREMRGVPEAWAAAAWVVLNRVNHPGWWGRDIVSTLTHKWQFSSMTAPGDANLVQWPQEDQTWEGISYQVDCVLDGTTPDPTDGATYYFTRPLTEPPAAWGTVFHTATIGGVQFYRQAT